MPSSRASRVARQRGQAAARDTAIIDQAGDLGAPATPPQAPANTFSSAPQLASLDYQIFPTTNSATNGALSSYATIHACPRCAFTPPITAVAFEGFQILLYPCPCGQDHADPAMVLSHHHHLFTSCEAALEASRMHASITPPAPLYNPEDIADATGLCEFEKMLQSQPGYGNMLRLQSTSQYNPQINAPPPAKRTENKHRVEGEDEEDDEEVEDFYPDRAEHVAAQRASPNVCITCNRPFSARVQVFKNGPIHTPFMMYRCGCGERFSREHPGMRVRVEIKQDGLQAQECDIEQSRLQVKGDFDSAANHGIHGWVLGRDSIGGDRATEYDDREELYATVCNEILDVTGQK